MAMAEQLIRAGKRLGCNVKIYSHELSEQEPIASVGTVIPGKRYSDPAVDVELDEIISRHDIHVVLPFVDPLVIIITSVYFIIVGQPISDVHAPYGLVLLKL